MGQSQEVGERIVVNPAAADDKLFVEVTDVRRGTAETGQPEFQAHGEDSSALNAVRLVSPERLSQLALQDFTGAGFGQRITEDMPEARPFELA